MRTPGSNQTASRGRRTRPADASSTITCSAEVAADHPGNVEVYDFGADVCPGGKFESTIDGVRIRLGDGVHFPYQPGADGSVVPTAKWLAWKLFPEVVRVGRLQMAGVPLR